MSELEEKLEGKLKDLNDLLWNRELPWAQIENWLSNFKATKDESGPDERLHAMHLLSRFTFYSSKMLRELLRALFRDHVRYPIVAKFRKDNNNTTDLDLINTRFEKELAATRFIGIGRPCDSGTHLLYYFRQENQLSPELFVSPHECLDSNDEVGDALARGIVRRLIFVDDFCGSGKQANRYSTSVVRKLKNTYPELEARYHVLFATTEGLQAVQQKAAFDVAGCICELDESFRCFSSQSRYFKKPPHGIDKQFSQAMCEKYGASIEPRHPLGFGACQLLLGFEHNIPNNTLPVFWSEGHTTTPWKPAFRRYRKGPNW